MGNNWVLPEIDPSLTPEEATALLDLALEIREKAYAPYSNFKVGAAVLAGSGELYAGCNVENASFGATICAERVAITNAISSGEKKIRAIAVIADYPEPVPPCGMCRQVASEFGRDAIILMANTSGEIKATYLEAILPGIFNLK